MEMFFSLLMWMGLAFVLGNVALMVVLAAIARYLPDISKIVDEEENL